MARVGTLVDTSILIDYLNGSLHARSELASLTEASISTVVWIEVMVKVDQPTEAETRAFLRRFTLLPVTDKIAEEAVLLRRARLKLPDALIYATARVHGLTLITRNTRDFGESMPGVRIPYREA